MIYPNPGINEIYIRENKKIGTVESLGIDGRKWVVSWSQSADNLYRIDVSMLPSGSYIMLAGGKKELFIKNQGFPGWFVNSLQYFIKKTNVRVYTY